MKKCIFLLLTALLVCSCTYKPPKAEMEARISKLESRVDNIKQQLDKEIKIRKEQYKDLKNSTPTKTSTSKPAPTRMQNSSHKNEKEKRPPRKDKKNKEQKKKKKFYNQALDLLLTKNKPQKAQKRFERFLDKYPQSDLIPNIYYWMGEAFYVQNKYEQSILYFKKVYNNFPEDPKAPDALLKTGYAYANKGDISNATFYLNNLIERNPNTKAAELAQQRLKSLNKEN